MKDKNQSSSQDSAQIQDIARTKKELLEEIHRLRQQMAELEGRTVDSEQAPDLEQKGLFSALIERAYDGITVIQNGYIVYANPRLAEIVGYAVEEMVDTHFIRYIHPDEAPKVEERYNLRMTGEQVPSRYETALLHKDGRRIEVEFNTGVISYVGKPADFVFIRDITERKENERRLRESETRYRSIVESAPEGIIILDWKGTITSCNTTFCKLTGFSQDEVVGIHFTKLGSLRLQDIPRWIRVFKLLIQGSPEDRELWEPIEFQWKHKNGTVRWGEAHVSPIPREGQRTSLQAIVLDITDRKETEREIKERQTYLEGVLASTPNAIVTLDAEQRVVEWNPGAESLFGYSPEEAIGHVLDNLVARHEFFDQATRWTKIMLSGKVIEARETVRFHKDGSPVDVIVAGSPIIVDDKLIGTVVLYTDITERKQAEKALEQRAAQLATINRISQQVTAILDQQALLQQAVDAVRDNLGYYRVAILLIDEETHELYVAVATDNFWDAIPDTYRQQIGEGVIGIAAKTRETVLVHDAANDPRVLKARDWLSPSSLSVPIQTGDWLIGVLEVESDEIKAYDDEDLTVMNILADQIATAMENARLYQETRQRMLEQETLRESALALTTTLDRYEVIERILAQLQKVVPYDTASVQLFRGQLLEIVGGRGFPNLEKLLGFKFDPQQTDNPNREVIRTQSSFIVEDAPVHYEEFNRSPHAAAGIRSWLGVPMLIGERVIGMIALDKKEPGFYTPEHARLAEAFAAQAAIAVENSRLFQAEREQRVLTQALEGAAAAVSSTLDLEQVLDRILEQVERVVTGDAFNVMLIEGQTVRVVRHRGYDPLGGGDYIANLTTNLTDMPTLKRMQNTGNPLVISDVTIDSDWVKLENARWIHAYVAAPIQMRGETLGFLNVDGSYPNQFTREDAQRLRAFADHAATAIENAKLYQKMLDYADHLEQRVQQRTAELQSQYARSDAILRNTTDGIVVTNVDGEIVQTNPVAHAWLHRTLLPEDADRLRQAVRALAKQAEALPERVLEMKGLDLELAAAPVVAEGKEDFLGVVIDIHDVSHLKALDRMKTRFVTNVSHELRTPVTTIKLYAHLMQKQPENWQEHLEMLSREADHQAQLVEDILQISRIDAGRLEMDMRPVSLHKLVEDAVQCHQALAQDRGLALQRQSAKIDSEIIADTGRLRQALNNLIENAINYTPRDGQICVRTDTEEREGRTWVTITVSDTGMGIPEEEFPHIFDRFFRGEEPRGMQLTGTGLGLAIVKEIVELHGGRVTVESSVGQGSTFVLWLPLAEAEA